MKASDEHVTNCYTINGSLMTNDIIRCYTCSELIHNKCVFTMLPGISKGVFFVIQLRTTRDIEFYKVFFVNHSSNYISSYHYW